VHSANEIVNFLGYTYSNKKDSEPQKNDIIQKLGLTQQIMEDIKTQVKPRMEQLKDSQGLFLTNFDMAS
jgi:hypothetical protein